jgi:hypothetical protein
MSDTSPGRVATAERRGATAPIDIAPQRRPGWNRVRRFIRTGADWLHLAFASAIVLGVFLQVYLIGAYIFGAGQGALDAHRATGFALQGPELFVLLTALIAWLPRTDLLLSFLIAIVGFVQAALASAHEWVGGLHPLLALVVLALAATLALRAIRRHRITAVARKRQARDPQLEGEPT